MSHSNTLLSQTLALIPRHVFQKLENRHRTGRSSRKFGFKEQFTVMAFIQLAARRSLRDALRCLESAGHRLYHLGLRTIARSTVADANKSRPVSFFKDLFAEMYALCAAKAPSHKFRFKSKLYSMDATTIQLCLTLFPWAKFRKGKGGIKMHTVLDHDGYLPAFINITDAKTHESRVAPSFDFQPGSIVVADRGYCNYTWFKELTDKRIFFVTRLKRNASYKLLERCSIKRKSGVTSDHRIEVSCKGQPLRLRRIGYRDQNTGKHYKFLTNNFSLSANTIADIYKERWQIELFFKEIKQNLHIKRFIGNSLNAVLTQIYSALTIYLLLAFQKILSKTGISVQHLFELVNVNLFGTTSLDDLLNSRRRIEKSNYENSLLPLALPGQ